MRNKLKAQVVDIDKLTDVQVDQMFEVFERYYASIKFQNFKNDLSGKNKVILLQDERTNHIKGFSTILNYHFELDGKKVRGIFSGDTIIEKDYWGGTALQIAFVTYMLKEKLKKPFAPLYWFLISKGYKTYLLMANNFKVHYPRFEQETPHQMKTIMDQFAGELYPEDYNPKSGLIEFQGIHDHLKCDVAPITREMLMKSPRIKFFAENNKTWQQGSELVCLSRFDLSVPFFYVLKALRKFTNAQSRLVRKRLLALAPSFVRRT